MKKINSFTASLVILTTLLITSCKKTESPAPSTGTGASNNFVGNWYNSENSTVNGPATYNVAISAPNSSTILFSFLYGFHTKISATFNGNSFTIPMQTIEGNNVSGSGVLANTTQINMMYIVNSGTYIDTVSAVLTK